jgi:hypothetical protein
MQTLVARDLDAVRRNVIRQAFLDVISDHKLSVAQARSLLDDALTKQFEYVETEILPESPEDGGRNCLKCGNPMTSNYGYSKCSRCRSERYLKPCVDCSRLAGRNASRCFECNKKFLAEQRRAKRNG